MPAELLADLPPLPGTADESRRLAADLPSQRPSRATVEIVRPVVDRGRFASKGSVGGSVTVEADVFADGHTLIDGSAWIARGGDDAWRELPLTHVGNDRHRVVFVPDEVGYCYVVVTGWVDHFAAWRKKLLAELDAGIDVSVTLADGVPLLTETALRARKAQATNDVSTIEKVREDCKDATVAGWVHSDELPAAMRRHADRHPEARSAGPFPVWVDRERARFSAWYEFFPRSTWNGHGPDGDVAHGTLADATTKLDHAAALGFDIAYLPPIHPIGEKKRKGPNNTPVANDGDLGSPWAIGSKRGGHTTIHPDLGTFADFQALVDRAHELDMEIALDIAFQCAPDHPWVREHPSWFTERSDGTIQFAENPPKRYEDIVPLDFDSPDWAELWTELRSVFTFWIGHGVKAFRVDNPHTKAFAFWEWCIETIRNDHPDVIFLSESFTRPRVMQRLAKLGFTQSYTYFTWRTEGRELREYGEEVASETVDFLRPNFWPNTPDILAENLQTGGRPTFVMRAVLAATLSSNWGVYGPAFELGEHLPLRPGSEEYLDSEKYEARHWDLDQAHTLAPLLGRLNQIRRACPALQHNEGLRFHHSDDPALLCYTKPDPTGPGGLLMVVNLDPDGRHGSEIDVDWAALGLGYEGEYTLYDELGGATFTWAGARNYVALDSHGLNAHIFSVSGPPATAPLREATEPT